MEISNTNKKNRTAKVFDVLAIISSLGIISWIISDYFGGMILFLLIYSIIIIPFVIVYLFSFIQTVISLIRKGLKQNRIRLISHLSVIGVIIAVSITNSDVFKSKRLITAILKDDLYHYTLVLRENGDCENNTIGMFGFTERFKGKYYLKNDSIIFTVKPYDNNFLPDTVLLDTIQGAIFITKDKNGNFARTKSWLNHFEIISEQP